MKVIADDLWFPEGPVWMPDGSILLVEIRRQTLTRVAPNGRKHIVAQLGGGPNGLAIGPDGAAYVCNNGGFEWSQGRQFTVPSAHAPADYVSGRIERVDLDSGRFETLYDKVGGSKLCGPNDLVFDRDGGFWFTDMGKARERDMDLGRVCYARTDGSMIREVATPLLRPNGVGLSPDGKTLYVAETETARLWAWTITGPGEVARERGALHGGRLVYVVPTLAWFDSLALEAGGNICVATIRHSGISVCAPGGGLVEFVSLPDDPFITNICFGGADLRKAYITSSGLGKLIEADWPRPGLKLHF